MSKIYRFKQLLNEYRYLSQELKYVDEILIEAHKDFEIYHKKYCEEKNIDLTVLNEKNSEKVNQIFSNSTAISKSLEKKVKQDEYDSKQIFRQIARRFHPDTFSVDEPNKLEYEVFSRERLKQKIKETGVNYLILSTSII